MDTTFLVVLATDDRVIDVQDVPLVGARVISLTLRAPIMPSLVH